MNKHRQDSHDSVKVGPSPQQQQQLQQSKRPRTSTACVRCHLKKVRCDGRRPNCDRCAANEKMCAYPTRRRSRNTQPTDMDPFIDDLSQLETRIRAIESEQEALWDLIQRCEAADNLTSRMAVIDQEVQISRASLARQRLLREQHIARSKQQQSSSPSSLDKNNNNSKQPPRKKASMVIVKDKQPQEQQQQMAIPPPPPTCTVQSPWDEMFPALAWEPPQAQPPQPQSAPHPQGPPKEWFDQQQQAQNAQQRLQQQQQAMYASSSTSTTSSGSPPFHPPNDVMIEPYELMNFVMDDESLMLNPQDNGGGPWLGHPRLS